MTTLSDRAEGTSTRRGVAWARAGGCAFGWMTVAAGPSSSQRAGRAVRAIVKRGEDGLCVRLEPFVFLPEPRSRESLETSGLRRRLLMQ